jgi:hypothetical protein
MTNYKTLPEVVAMLDATYSNVYYAVKTKRITNPRCIGKAMLFTDKQIDTLREFFAKRKVEVKV